MTRGRFLPDPFMAAVVLAVALASVLPARDPWGDGIRCVSTIAISALFFMQGARLERKAVVAAVINWRLHLAILSATFVGFPLAGLALSKLAPDLLPAPLWTGVLFLCALPSTVQSCVAFTSIARGNVAAAVTAAATSNLIGIVLTPVVIGALASVDGAAAPMSSIGKVVLQLLAPFIAGQLMRPLLRSWIEANTKLITFGDRSVIVLAVYVAFSTAVIDGVWTRTEPIELAILVGILIVLLTAALAGLWFAGIAMRFSREDRITLLMCGTQKTLATGVPMAQVLFSGPAMGFAILPVMIFHQMQLMVCAVIAPRLSAALQPAQETL